MRKPCAQFGCVAPLARVLCVTAIAGMLAGCKTLDGDARDSIASRLSWLMLASNQTEGPPRLNPEQIRPAASLPEVAADSLLEVTVWDLFEPDKPHTFPVRVTTDETIGVPMLEPLSIAGLGLKEIETKIAGEYRDREILLNPRVLVRSLDAGSVRISVAGAVQQPGFVDLPRTDASVYTALLAAGGPKKSAGVHIGVSRHEVAGTLEQTAARPAAPRQASDTELALHANSLDTVAVVPPGPEAPAAASQVTWFDLTQPADCEALRTLALHAGDSIIVKPTIAPVRIGGDVVRSGPIALPVAATVTVWQALDMAGGPAHPEERYQIVLVRPSSDGRGPQRWAFDVPRDTERPAAAPLVQPGDMIHVERSNPKSLKTLATRPWL